MSKSIVCGVDGSTDSQAALEVAAQFAALGATLVLAHVAEPEPYAAAYPFGGTSGATAVAEELESPLKSAFPGSVSHSLVGIAGGPVPIVPPGATEEE